MKPAGRQLSVPHGLLVAIYRRWLVAFLSLSLSSIRTTLTATFVAASGLRAGLWGRHSHQVVHACNSSI